MKSYYGKKWVTYLVVMAMVFSTMFSAAAPQAKAATEVKVNSSVYLNTTKKTLYLNKSKQITFDFDVKNSKKEKGAKYYWYVDKSQGNTNAVTVDKTTGIVTAKNAGTAYVVCKITLANGDILRPQAKVTVINHITEVDISNIPENETIKVGMEYDFDKAVLNTSGGNGVKSEDITRWELKDNTAGIEDVSTSGVVFPYNKGEFYIRAITFENTKKYEQWLLDKEKNTSLITASSKWYKITTEASNQALVSTQKQLDFVLAHEEYVDITLATKKAYKFIIPEGNFTTKSFTVNAPNADVENRGNFKKINVQAIKDSTWIEYANGNIVTISDTTARFVIEEGAEVKQIVVDTPNSVIQFEIQGNVQQIRVEQPAQLVLSGETESIPVVVEEEAGGSSIEASVPMNLSVKADTNIVLNEGAEESVLDKSASTVDLLVNNKTEEAVAVSTNGEEKEIISAGQSTIPTPTPEPTLEATPTPKAKATATPTPKAKVTATPTPKAKATATPTPKAKATATPTPTPKAKVTATPTPTPTPTVTPSPTQAVVPYTPINIPSTPSIPSDVTAPIITLNKGNNLVLNYKDTFTDPGAKAVDDVDGDISKNIAVSGTVKTSVPGTYILTYTVSDKAGNKSEQKLTVVVKDVTAPSITLNKGNNLILNYKDTFVDPGAKAGDDVDGDISKNIAVTGAVNTSIPGTYTLTYKVSDKAGNKSEQKLTVVVKDVTEPTLTLNKGNSLVLNYKDTFVDPGAKAVDDVDGDISKNITVTGTINTSVPGTYILTYTVSDKAGNKLEQKLTVVVKDVTAPSITLNKGNNLVLNYKDTFVDPGAKAVDNVDGDISKNIIVTGIVDTNTLGTYVLTYSVSDKAGNKAEQKLTADVKDIKEPVLTLNGAAILFIKTGDTYNELGAKAYDNGDGDVTNNIKLNNDEVDTKNAGTYRVFYDVFDKAGNGTHLERIVVVSLANSKEESIAPVLQLKGDIIVYTPIGEKYTDAGVAVADNKDSEEYLRTKLTVDNKVDITKEGLYEVTYNVTDSDGNAAQTVVRKVVVWNDKHPVDYFAPNINLHWGDYYYTELGGTFVEPGYDAWDDIDGEITDKVQVTEDADISSLGTHEIHYTVTDSSGKTTDVIRYVVVEDKQQPVISVSGAEIMYLKVGNTYKELGATANDNVDGDITDKIKINGDVDTHNDGIYHIFYEVYDVAGNGTHGERIVVVSATDIQEDTIAPELILNGYDFYYTPIGKEYADAGVTVADNKDSEEYLRTKLTVDNKVDITKEGLYEVTYNVTDSDGNAAQPVVRNVIVKDDKHPVDYFAPNINLHWGDYYYTELGESFVEPGYDAWDDIDGDITYKVQVTEDTDISNLGTHEIHYTVTDSSGRTTDVIRYVEVRDTKQPVISVSGAAIMFLKVGDIYNELGAAAYDTADGDITYKIKTNGYVDVYKAGTYSIFYEAYDAAGNGTHEDRIVVVSGTDILEEAIAPELLLNGYDTYYTPIGEMYTDAGVTVADNKDSEEYLKTMLLIDDNVDVTIEGLYSVTYNVTDSDGNAAQPVTRNVVVWDDNNPIDYFAPNIDLHWGDYYYIELGKEFNEPGFYAWDDIDGDITDKVEVTGDVDTSKVGTCERYYTVTDSSGRTTDVIRYVEVRDTKQPVITVCGAPIMFLKVGDTYNELGATAYDNVDGDITSKIEFNGYVDTHKAGTYFVYYDVNDAAGNGAHEERIVVISTTDTQEELIAPVLLLNGYEVCYTPIGVEYTDADVTVADNKDSEVDLRNNLVIDNQVDINFEGIYPVIFNVTDSDGNAAQSMTRMVVVWDENNPIDYFAPDINLYMGDFYHIELGESFVDPSYEAWDDIDGNITNKVKVTGHVNTSMAGIYELRYSVTDLVGRTTEKIRWVEVTDTKQPVLSVSGAAIMFLKVGDTYKELGATAYDKADGDITNKILFNGFVDTSLAGTYYIYYDVIDNAGNSSHAVRTIVISEADELVAPMMVLKGYQNFYIPIGKDYNDEGVLVADDKDSPETLKVVVNNPVDTSTEGLYTVAYNVTDSDNNAAQQVTRTVIVWDSNHPIDYFEPFINLHGGDHFEIQLGIAFEEPGYDAWDDIDNDLTGKVIVSGTVDINKAGVYEIHYTVTDSSNRTTEVIRYVEVRDMIQPVISVSGAAIMFLNVGDTYTEYGATAYDTVDGDITSKIIINGYVDTSSSGMYYIYYDVVDAAGNSTHAERTVIVSTMNAVEMPNVILYGNKTVFVPQGTSYNELGAAAYDYEDQAYLPVSVSGGAISINDPGCYTVTYSATDSNNNETQVTRNVIVFDPNNIVDYLSPEIYIIGSAIYYVNLNSAYIEQGATAWDDTDTNIGSKIVIDNQVDTSVAGIYYVTYSVTDTSGRTASVQRRVEVLDYPAP